MEVIFKNGKRIVKASDTEVTTNFKGSLTFEEKEWLTEAVHFIEDL
jgi:hypothetical protein